MSLGGKNGCLKLQNGYGRYLDRVGTANCNYMDKYSRRLFAKKGKGLFKVLDSFGTIFDLKYAINQICFAITLIAEHRLLRQETFTFFGPDQYEPTGLD